jgi:hypothetical protein
VEEALHCFSFGSPTNFQPCDSIWKPQFAPFPKVLEPASISAVHSVKTPFCGHNCHLNFKEATCRLAVYLGTDIESVWGWP